MLTQITQDFAIDFDKVLAVRWSERPYAGCVIEFIGQGQTIECVPDRETRKMLRDWFGSLPKFNPASVPE